MNLQEIKEFIEFELNKHQSGNTLNKTEYNLCLKYANIEYYKWLTGLPEEYQPGRPIPRVQYPMTQKLMNWLDKLTAREDKLAIANGFGSVPSDYASEPTIRYYNEKEKQWSKVEILTHDHFANRSGQSLMKPSLEYPVCRFIKGKIEFLPSNMSHVEMIYLRYPVTPVYAAKNINDTYVYDDKNSVQLEWPEECHTDITQFILEYAAVNLRENFNFQNALRRKAQGK